MRNGQQFKRAPCATLTQGRADGHELLIALLRDLKARGVEELAKGLRDEEIDRDALQGEFDKLPAIADRLEKLWEQPKRVRAEREAALAAKRAEAKRRKEAEAKAQAARQRASKVLEDLRLLAETDPEGARKALEGVVASTPHKRAAAPTKGAVQ